MNRYWITVVSHEHVKTGMDGGFACASHGKKKPLEAMGPHDGIIYYSPTELYGVKKPLQQFTALCISTDAPPYQKKLFEGFNPWQRDAEYKTAQPVSVKGLLDELSFISNKKYWGMAFRRGVFSIPEKDFKLIAQHMGVSV